MDFDHVQALRYPLFQDDFGEPGDKVLSDKIVTAKSEHDCVECLSKILPKQLYRRHVGVYSGNLHTYKYCPLCCVAMAATFNGNHNAMDERFKVRQENLK